MTIQIPTPESPRLQPSYRPFRRTSGAAVIGLSFLASAMQPSVAHDHSSPSSPAGSSPLVEKVRHATARYRDINVALGEGWIQATPCVSGPNEGAMGVHFLNPDRLHDGMLKAEEPEILIYEPGLGGNFSLVGVEYLVLASEWAARNGPGVAASVDGHLANLIPEPNRYALPALYELHVWAWENNPNGTFSDWNSRVSCDRQRVPQ
ncbi:MAG: hypothetical protein ABI641_12225 [Caldimonas sp.]